MTMGEARKLLKTGHPVKVRDRHFHQEIVLTISRLTRWDVIGTYTMADGTTVEGVFDRGDLELLGGL